MAGSTNAPFGLQPVRHWNGNPWNQATRVLCAVDGNTALYVGDPVYRKVVDAKDTSGIYLGCDILTGGTVNNVTRQVLGVMMSRAGTIVTTGPGRPGMISPVLQTDKVYLPADTDGGLINACVDISVCFIAQSNGSGTPAYTQVGTGISLVAGTGGSDTGISGWALAMSTTSATATTQQTLLIGLWDDPTNAATDTYAIWEVLLNIPYIALGGYSAVTGVLGL